MQAFISYKSEYYDFARKVCETLKSWGHNTWFAAENIPEGTYWREEIQKGLDNSNIVIGVVTPEAQLSREVMWEWDYAIANSDKRLLLLIHRETDLMYHLNNIQYIDFTKNEALAFTQLQNALIGSDTSLYQKQETAIESRSEYIKEMQLNDREIMLQKVHDFWIKSVLHNVIGESGSLTIGLENTMGVVLKHRDYGDYQFPDNTLEIDKIFADLQRELLILGAPGSGKTILLLQLAEKLIAQAQADDKQAIPVVFNLSSWAATQKPLHDWLIDELKLKYQLPQRLSKRWIADENIILLLDGLDEVVEEYRDDCLNAINNFRQDYRGVDMVICSRIAEYEAMSSKLDLKGAITLQALSEEQVATYLADESYAILREEVQTDENLRGIATVPFLLNTMAYAYRDTSKIGLTLAEDEERTDHLFEQYVEKRIETKKTEDYSPQDIRRYLRWLAGYMVDKGETTFAVESLSSENIETAKERWFRGLRIAYGLIFFAWYLSICILPLNLPILTSSTIIFLFLAFSAWRSFKDDELSSFIPGFKFLHQARQWRLQNIPVNWRDWWQKGFADEVAWIKEKFPNIKKPLLLVSILFIGGIIIAVSVILAISFLLTIPNPEFAQVEVQATSTFGSRLSSVGMLVGFVLILMIGSGFREVNSHKHHRPNQGLLDTLRTSMIVTALCAISFFLIGITLRFAVRELVSLPVADVPARITRFEFLDAMIPDKSPSQWNDFSIQYLEQVVNIPMYIVLIIFCWHAFGGRAILNYLEARLILKQRGNIPDNYAKFLDFAATDLHILRKVGGSYIFRHRYLLEYFAGKKLE